jgi:hypothetical protein
VGKILIKVAIIIKKYMGDNVCYPKVCGNSNDICNQLSNAIRLLIFCQFSMGGSEIMKKLYGNIRFFHSCIGTFDNVMKILVKNTLCFTWPSFSQPEYKWAKSPQYVLTCSKIASTILA